MTRPKGSKNKLKDQTMPTKTAGTELSVIENDQPKSVLVDMSNRYGMEPAAFEATVRATCMRPDKTGRIPTREEFAAFLLVAKEYNLNPLTKEIYAYASKGGGIVPIVSVDGWVNLVNSHGQCDGFEFDMEHSADGKLLISCTCRLYRKDRSHPTTITEYFSECVRDTEPWKMKHRMLRHKSLIQAARYAFGFSGIYDEDEGQKIAEIDPNKDAGPPRATAADPKLIEGTTNPPAEPAHDSEEARDGTPPRRAAKPAEPDPISSGPQRAVAKDTGPSAKPVAPFKIPGNGETFESWAEKYIQNIQTSPDTATAYKWIDVNSDPLGRLTKGKPSVYATVKKATEQVMENLRDAQKKAQDKAKATPPSGDMDEAALDEMDRRAENMVPDVPTGGPADTNPETILAWAKAQFATVENADDLELFYINKIEPHTNQLFPPDQEIVMQEYRNTEVRLGVE